MRKINYHVLEEDGKPVFHCFFRNYNFIDKLKPITFRP